MALFSLSSIAGTNRVVPVNWIALQFRGNINLHVPRKNVENSEPADGLSIAVVNGEPAVTITHQRPKRMGRPRITLDSLSQKKKDEILKLARLGMNYKMIAGAVGMSVGKLIQLRDENPDFQNAIERERESFVADNLSKLRQHANTSPQSAQWLLERVRPEEFSAKAELRVSGGVSNSVTIDIGKGICEKLAEARRQAIDCAVLSSEKIHGSSSAEPQQLPQTSPD